MDFKSLYLADSVPSRQPSALPDLSEEEQRACLRRLAEEAMEAVPAYLEQLRET